MVCLFNWNHYGQRLGYQLACSDEGPSDEDRGFAELTLYGIHRSNPVGLPKTHTSPSYPGLEFQAYWSFSLKTTPLGSIRRIVEH